MVPLLPLRRWPRRAGDLRAHPLRRGRRYHADLAKLMPLTYAVVLVIVVLGVTTIYLDIVNPVDL